MSEYTMQLLLKKGRTILEESGIEEAGQDAWLLLEYATGKNRTQYLADPYGAVTKEQEKQYLGLIRRRGKHIPVQHLTHQAFFMGYEFYVNENVLIPRQDTEILVEKALECMQERENPQILDMCTGSGCILLSLLLYKAGSRGRGVDISPEALSVARRNARNLRVEDRADFVESDLFKAPCFSEICGKKEGTYDMIISNPPYIATAEIEELMEEVRLYDPRLALDGREDGLWFYREITRESEGYLKPGGWLLYEIGWDQGKAVSELMQESGWENVQIIRDLAGLDRVVCGQRPVHGYTG